MVSTPLPIRDKTPGVPLKIILVDDEPLARERLRRLLSGQADVKIASLEEQLPAEGFLRVSRSAILNLRRVRELQSVAPGEHVAILLDNQRVTHDAQPAGSRGAAAFGLAPVAG